MQRNSKVASLLYLATGQVKTAIIIFGFHVLKFEVREVGTGFAGMHTIGLYSCGLVSGPGTQGRITGTSENMRKQNTTHVDTSSWISSEYKRDNRKETDMA